MKSSAILVLTFALGLVLNIAPAESSPLNQWRISCGADPGTVVKKGKDWHFKTSSNHCSGGIFNQRAELSTKHVSPTHRGTYQFTSLISMVGGVGQKFSIFQIHDGRHGCAPPFKVTVLKSGFLELTSDIKLGEGEACKRGHLNVQRSPNKFVADGREQEFKVLIDFDGAGNFDAIVWLDGRVQANGRYEISSQNNRFKPKRYYFKHGVYSQHQFPFEMVSSGMRVKKVRISK